MSAEPNTAELRSRIMDAFADAYRPRSDEITSCRCDECCDIRDYFSDAPQFKHDVEDLRYHYSALSLLTPQAFVYWLPAFLLAVLDKPKVADVIVQDIPSHLCMKGRLSDAAFTPCQRDAIVAFLEHGARHFYNGSFADSYLDALDAARAWHVR